MPVLDPTHDAITDKPVNPGVEVEYGEPCRETELVVQDCGQIEEP